MGVFDRLNNVAKGKASKAVGDLERANPAAVYEAAIDNAVARIAEHKNAVAGLAAERNKVAEAIEELEREQAQIQVALAEAVREEEDETAVVLLARRDELEATVADKRRIHAEVAAQVEETKHGLEKLRTDVQDLKRERESALAKLAVAQAAIDIDEATSGLSDSAQARGLESVRSSINVLEQQAHEGYLDEEGNSVRGRAAALGKKAREADARAELERLKRQMNGEPEPSEPSDDPADPDPPEEAPKRDL